MKHHSIQLYDYHVWANQKVFAHLKGLPQELLQQEIQSVFSSLSNALVHIYVVDSIWLSAMSGDSFDEIRATAGQIAEEAKGRNLAELENLYAVVADRFYAFFHRQQDMEALYSHHHPQFGTLKTSFAQILQHVVNHGTYHRGNLSAMLHQLGFAGVPIDYVHFLYKQQS